MTVALTLVKRTHGALPPATATPSNISQRFNYPACMSSTTASFDNDAMTHFNIVVIGAGQAGLSAAGTLHRRGLVPGEDFAILDGNAGPGGAWRHRWDALTLGRAHGVTTCRAFRSNILTPGDRLPKWSQNTMAHTRTIWGSR